MTNLAISAVRIGVAPGRTALIAARVADETIAAVAADLTGPSIVNPAATPIKAHPGRAVGCRSARNIRQLSGKHSEGQSIGWHDFFIKHHPNPPRAYPPERNPSALLALVIADP